MDYSTKKRGINWILPVIPCGDDIQFLFIQFDNHHQQLHLVCEYDASNTDLKGANSAIQGVVKDLSAVGNISRVVYNVSNH